MNRLTTLGVILVGVVAIITASSLFIVSEREQALVIQFGEVQREISSPGLHLKVPFIQSVMRFDKRVLDFDAKVQEVPTSEQEQVLVDTFARYQIVDPLKFFQSVGGTEFQVQARLTSIINSNVRQVLGRNSLKELLSNQRSGLMENIKDLVNDEAGSFGIKVVDVRIKRVDKPETNSKAIFGRMITQRQQLATKYRAEGEKEGQIIQSTAEKQARIILAEARKKAAVLRGEGDGEAERIYREAYGKDTEFFQFYRSMQAYRNSLNGNTTKYVGPTDGKFFEYFNEN